MTNFKILKRLYKDYTKKYLLKILTSVFFTVLLAASTSSVAYLLDPAIKHLFIEQEKKLVVIIPLLSSSFYNKRCIAIFSKSYNDWCLRKC